MNNNEPWKNIIAGIAKGLGGDLEAPFTVGEVEKMIEWHEQEIARLNALELKEE
jgi:hypothetical protein